MAVASLRFAVQRRSANTAELKPKAVRAGTANARSSNIMRTVMAGRRAFVGLRLPRCSEPIRDGIRLRITHSRPSSLPAGYRLERRHVQGCANSRRAVARPGRDRRRLAVASDPAVAIAVRNSSFGGDQFRKSQRPRPRRGREGPSATTYLRAVSRSRKMLRIFSALASTVARPGERVEARDADCPHGPSEPHLRPAVAAGGGVLALGAGAGNRCSFRRGSSGSTATSGHCRGTAACELRLLPAVSLSGTRWSGDTWLLLRHDSSGPLTPGEPSYGRSQAGAVLRYRLAPSSLHRPSAYVRATRALVSPQETEVAAGLAARPLGGVPLSVAGELRVSQGSGRTRGSPGRICRHRATAGDPAARLARRGLRRGRLCRRPICHPFRRWPGARRLARRASGRRHRNSRGRRGLGWGAKARGATRCRPERDGKVPSG